MAPRKRREASTERTQKGPTPDDPPRPKSKRAKAIIQKKPVKAPNPEETLNPSSPSLEEIPPPYGDALEKLNKLEHARLREEIKNGKAMKVGIEDALTVILHWGGDFVHLPEAKYVGGDKIELESVEPCTLTLMTLTEFGLMRKAGGALFYRFYTVKNMKFKLISSDEELLNLLNENLENGTMHIYLEPDVLETESSPIDENSHCVAEYEETEFVVGSVFFGAEHRVCVRHMHSNMKTAGFRGMMYKNLLWNCAQATTPGEFRECIRKLKDHSEPFWEWFNDKPPSQWSKAFFRENARCDMLLNNVSESFNSCILEARDKPIITLVEWIRVYIMMRLQKNREKALAKWVGKLCPKIQNMLDRYKGSVGDFIPIKCHDKHYEVSCYDGTQYAVDLEKWQCTCRVWQLTGIPCKHATCAILSMGGNVEDFVDRYYFVETYIKVYQHAILGVSYEKLWGDSNYIPPLPPHFAKPSKGRPVRLRRREADEPSHNGKKRKGDLLSNTRLSRIRKKRGNKSKGTENVNNNEDATVQEDHLATEPMQPNVILPPSADPVDQPHVDEEMTDIEANIEDFLMNQEAPIPGPSMYHQLSQSLSQRSSAHEEINISQMSQPFASQELPAGPSNPHPMPSRVNIRAPAPFTESGAKAARINPNDVQPEKEKRLVEINGIKYMDLSMQPNEK